MNFGMLVTLVGVVGLSGMMSIVFLVIDTKQNDSKRPTLMSALAVLSFFVFVATITFGRVDSYSGGAKIEDDKTITQFLSYNGENYTSKIRPVGKIVIKKIPKSSHDANRAVLIERHLLKGTTIYVDEDHSDGFDELNK